MPDVTRAAKSALAAASYVTRRHRRPASIIRQQARRKTEPWPSKQAQIISDLCLQLKDAERPLAAQIGRIRSGPGFCPQSHYVIILAISRQCPVVANVQMPLTVNTANAHHHERELLHTRCLCTPTMAYAVPSRKRLRTSVGLSRFPDGARAGFIRYSLAPLNCWPDDSAGNTRPRGRRTARG